MQRRTLYILIAVAVVLSLSAWMHHKKKKAASAKKFSFGKALQSAVPSMTMPPRGALWAKFGKSRAPGTTRAPKWRVVSSEAPAQRVAIPTIRPEVIPPYTLGPVPNGLTRVPEPPTMQPVSDSNLVLVDGQFSLFTKPAGAGASVIGGLNVPAVQNPWSVDSWKFLLNADVSSAMGVIKNLFPSFPATARSVKEGPRMSGALTLVFNDENKVVQIVRD